MLERDTSMAGPKLWVTGATCKRVPTIERKHERAGHNGSFSDNIHDLS